MANGTFTDKANFIWTVADLIRDDFKRGKYQDVILPLTVLRRIDCVLEPTKEKVLSEHVKYKDKLKDLDPVLRKASGFAFYNTSKYNFERLLDDPNNISKNLNAYINGFSENMREVIEKFDFRNTISKLSEANLLYLVIQRFTEIDLHPDKVDNHEMGTVFEELIRRFNEALDENPGEHFTPREVVNLMVKMLLAVENEALNVPQKVIKVADPACGTGGMLTIAKGEMLAINPKLNIYLYGQEVNPETFAVCKSDLYMKSADGRDAENIAFGSTLSRDAHVNERFDYQLANPPYGKEWKKDQQAVEAEAEKANGRFSAGTPRISDGQMLFLQHMLSHMSEGGGRVAIVMNGNPLFTGDAGSGESEIRRWILENDWLEAIVALPEQLFYNTGIATGKFVPSPNPFAQPCPARRWRAHPGRSTTPCAAPARSFCSRVRHRRCGHHPTRQPRWHMPPACRLALLLPRRSSRSGSCLVRNRHTGTPSHIHLQRLCVWLRKPGLPG